jgi:hypothetical protein
MIGNRKPTGRRKCREICMDPIRPLLWILAGAAAASVAFFFGLDRSLPHWLRWRDDATAVALYAPYVSPDASGCELTYAIDNRTDHRVFLTMNLTSQPPLEPRSPYDGSRYRPDPPDYDPDSSDNSAVSVPESEAPSVAPPDDFNSGTANGGSSYGGYGTEEVPRHEYGAPAGYGPGAGYGAQGSYSGSPPPDYGPPSPAVAPSRGYYGNPPGAYAGSASDQSVSLLPPAAGPESGVSEIKPGQIFFSSSDNNPQGNACNDAAHTVTIELHDGDKDTRR